MTRHFFAVDELTADQDRRLRIVFVEDPPSPGDGVVVGRNITPAVVEQLAGEFDTVDDFISALEAV